MQVSENKMNFFMAKRCVSFDELAELSGLSRITIRKMMKQKVNTRPKTIGKIAKALGVGVEELIEEDAATSNQNNQGSGKQTK